MKIYPVIHYLNRELALAQVETAALVGADGVFLISHHNNDAEVIAVAIEAAQSRKSVQRDFAIGINLLSQSPLRACQAAKDGGLDMVWADDMGVDSKGANAMALALSDFGRENPNIRLFASVAFKYRPDEPQPSLAAKHALALGFIPTTSGTATGNAPEPRKIIDMSRSTKGELAIASGMTPENVGHYAPHLSYILVASGVSLDAYCIDQERLKMLIHNAKRE